LKGLFAVGDAATGKNGSTASTVGGLMVGDQVHEYIKDFDADLGNSTIDEGQVQQHRESMFAHTKVSDGVEALEIECSIRYICDRYSGMYRSEGKLQEGLRRLSSLKKYWMHKVSAPNPHYMLSWLELRNLMDVAELHMISSLERKETRGNYIRVDCPEMNPELDKMTVQRLEKGKVVTEFRKMPELDKKYDEVDVGVVKPEKVKHPWGTLF
jgi:succinate dehydrogenase/fumarate reductase flavoprotein subunit